MSRISNLGATTSIVTQILETQKRLFELEKQVATEKASDDYAGIADESERLVNLENTNSQLQRYIQNNAIQNLRLNLATTAIVTTNDAGNTTGGIKKVMQDFKNQLATFGANNRTDQTRVDDIQDFAFRSLQNIEALLNSEADGRFLFGGARVTDAPVDFGLSNLTAFQAKYDGARVTYPTTRDAHISDAVVNKNATTLAANYLTFARDNGASPALSRITAAGATDFTNIQVGSTITIAGSGTANGANDGTFTVSAVTATTIDIVTEMYTNEGPVAATLTAADGTVIDNVGHGGLTFARTNAGTPERSTVTAATAGALAGLAVGETFTITGAANANNNGTFTIQANTGTAITIETKMLTDYGSAGTTRYFDFTDGAGGNINFNDNTPNEDTIVGAASTFVDARGNPLAVGTHVTIAGATTAGNNGTFRIAAISSDASTITVRPSNFSSLDAGLTTEASAAGMTIRVDASAGSITAGGYYSGDTLQHTHRVDDLRNFEDAITAIDPAFEKAIRAMAIIAQGAFGTEGGLDQNTGRADDAMFLITSALETTVTGTPPYGTELRGNIEDIERTIGFNQVVISRATDLHEDFSAFIDSRVAGIENVDPLDTITKLLDDQRALEASFQTFSRLRQLSLTNFI